MSETPFKRLFAVIDRRLILITIIVAGLQAGVWITDIIVFADRGKSPFVPLMEALAPWLLLPVLRRVYRGESVGKVLDSPYMAIIGGYIIVLSMLMVGFILAFQILSWIYHGPMHGGIFYYASLVMVFIWAARLRKSRV